MRGAPLPKRKKSEDMAKAFGLPGLDDASNRAFAAKLTKYAGWRSVTYRGKGVFDVDYHFEGRATQDFLFPALPDNNLIIPVYRHPPPMPTGPCWSPRRRSPAVPGRLQRARGAAAARHGRRAARYRAPRAASRSSPTARS